MDKLTTNETFLDSEYLSIVFLNVQLKGEKELIPGCKLNT